MPTLTDMKVGWIGTGRMGFTMARRLARAGCKLTVWNRTRAKAEPLAQDGARIADSLADLGGSEVVFCMLATWDDVKHVIAGPGGLLSQRMQMPRTIIECSSISVHGSAELRAILAASGIELLAAPVSGNAKVVTAGKLSFVVSGPRPAYDRARPLFEQIGKSSTWVGEAELARTVKICHNVFLGVVAQSLAEVTVLAQKAGVPRHAFLDFLNQSVMGSTFTRYKTPALVNLDFKVTFTPELLRKDMDLGLELARTLGVPMPAAALTREQIQALIGNGFTDQDFATLVVLQARASGMALESEQVQVDDGLS
ncbi:MAG TPA: NAD(P)-dependent oxidoreductase [Burkholderiales bacterium]|nr:NAD(P)-dependent oxidoreductase [Burkholderiales bacterium]